MSPCPFPTTITITPRVTVIGIVVGALGMVSKGLGKRLEEHEIRGRIETIKTTVLLRSA